MILTLTERIFPYGFAPESEGTLVFSIEFLPQVFPYEIP
jgi:hypothetical protein